MGLYEQGNKLQNNRCVVYLFLTKRASTLISDKNIFSPKQFMLHFVLTTSDNIGVLEGREKNPKDCLRSVKQNSFSEEIFEPIFLSRSKGPQRRDFVKGNKLQKTTFVICLFSDEKELPFSFLIKDIFPPSNHCYNLHFNFRKYWCPRGEEKNSQRLCKICPQILPLLKKSFGPIFQFLLYRSESHELLSTTFPAQISELFKITIPIKLIKIIADRQ